jgi:hypothetical protein
VSPIALALTGLVLLVPLAGGLVRDARRVVERCLPGFGAAASPTRAYVILVGPGVLLQLAYAAGFGIWRDSPVPMVLGSVFGVPLFGLLGVPWNRVTSRGERARYEAPVPSAAAVPSRAWAVGLACLAVAYVWVFGPTPSARTGIVFGPVGGDLYPAAAQRIELDLDLDRAPPTLRVTSRSTPDLGSPFRRRITESLASTGPTREGARQLAQFIATWNLDEATVDSVTSTEGRDGLWTWHAMLTPAGDRITVRIWPLTRVRESRIETLRIVGAATVSRPWPPSEPDGGSGVLVQGRTASGAFTWTRPDSMTQVDSFVVTLR